MFFRGEVSWCFDLWCFEKTIHSKEAQSLFLISYPQYTRSIHVFESSVERNVDGIAYHELKIWCLRQFEESYVRVNRFKFVQQTNLNLEFDDFVHLMPWAIQGRLTAV